MDRVERELFESFPLGGDERCRISTDCGKTQLNNNILVMGGTGAGKTVSVIQPILLHLEYSNAVVIYTKQETMEIPAAFLSERGYDVQCIDFDNPEEGRSGCDPLTHCRSFADVKDLAHGIIHSSPQDASKDPYWQDAAENLLNVVLRFVWSGYYKRGRTMAAALELLDLLHWPIADDDDDDEDEFDCHHDADDAKYAEVNRLFSLYQETGDKEGGSRDKIPPEAGKQEKESGARFRWKREQNQSFREKPPSAHKKTNGEKHSETPRNSYVLRKAFGSLKWSDPWAYSVWKSFLALPESTGACVASCLQVPLQNVFTPEVRRILSNPRQFSFESLLEPKKVLFLHISPVSEAQHRFIGIFYHQLFKTLFEMAEKEKTRRLPHPVHVLCDDFATGCRIDGFPQYISVFREKRISAVMLIQSETQLTSMYNRMEAATIINNCDTIIYLGGMDVSTCESLSRRAGRPMLELLTMPIGTEYFFRRGQKPIVTKRYDTYSDPLYAQMFRSKDMKEQTVSCQVSDIASA